MSHGNGEGQLMVTQITEKWNLDFVIPKQDLLFCNQNCPGVYMYFTIFI